MANTIKYNHMKNIYLTLFCLIVSLGFFSCKKHKKDSDKSAEIPVNVAYPLVENITLKANYPGYLQAQKTVNLVARVSGVIEKINFKPGEFVKKGETLFVIEPTTYKDQFIQAQATLNQGYANIEYMQANYDRTAEAMKMNAVSQIALIQARSDFEKAQADIKNYQAALQTARTNYGYCYVRAPYAGLITNYNYDIGNYVSGTSAPTLATIYKDDSLYVYFSISETEFLSYHSTMTLQDLGYLTILPEGLTEGDEFKAKLDYYSPNVQTSTGTIQLRAVVANKNQLLKDGMFVRIIFPYCIQNNAILVPDASIGNDQLGTYMYIVNDSSKVEYRHVETGELVNETLRVINSGITQTEKYVTNALLKVRPGMSVKPVLKENSK